MFKNAKRAGSIFILMALSFIALSDSQKEGKTVRPLMEPYLDQKPPRDDPVLFAPGIVSTGEFEHSSPVFTPDLREIFWSTSKTFYVKYENGVWSRPTIAPFNKVFENCENPFISPDGRKIYFSAILASGPRHYDLWASARTLNGWDDPEPLKDLNTEAHDESQPTIAKNGTIYYVGYYDQATPPYGLYSSKREGSHYLAPVLMEEKFNQKFADWTPYIAPDESYFIFCSFRPGGYGSGDLYVSFKKNDGSWGKVKNMGNKVNGPANDRFPNITPDGRYLFFNSTRKIAEAGDNEPGNGKGDVYWVRSSILEYLKDNDLDVIDVLYEEAVSGHLETVLKKYDRLKNRHARFYNFEPSVLYTVGLRLIENRKISEALKIFELNSKRYPKADLAYQNILSLIFIRDGDAMEKLSADLVRRNQKDRSIGIYDMNYLGDRFLKAGLAHEALEIFRLNAKLFPDSAGVYKSLGDAHQALRDEKAAIGCYQKALQLNPGDRGVEEKLNRLGKKKQ